jgi:hypothetical protein
MTKAQGRRSQKNKGRYKDQFNITERNKKRREAARKRKLEKNADKIAARKAARIAKNIAKGIPRRKRVSANNSQT